MKIQFETAKLAKEKGFDWLSDKMYTINGDICSRESVLGSRVGLYLIPMQSELQKWLREYFSIDVLVGISRTRHPRTYVFSVFKDRWLASAEGGAFDTYNECLEAGLVEGLKLIKDE